MDLSWAQQFIIKLLLILILSCKFKKKHGLQLQSTQTMVNWLRNPVFFPILTPYVVFILGVTHESHITGACIFPLVCSSTWSAESFDKNKLTAVWSFIPVTGKNKTTRSTSGVPLGALLPQLEPGEHLTWRRWDCRWAEVFRACLSFW